MGLYRPYSTNITNGPSFDRIVAAFVNAHLDTSLATVEFQAAVIKTVAGAQTTAFEESFSTEIIGLEYIDETRQNLSIKMHNVQSTLNLVVSRMVLYYNTDSKTGFAYNPDTALDL